MRAFTLSSLNHSSSYTVNGSRRPTRYREQVLNQIQTILQGVPRAAIALDFGSGDGWFADQLERLGHAGAVVPAEVSVRSASIRRPVLFDGQQLPFADEAFDITFAIDVFHHCPNPADAIKEALRCTKNYFVIKDHTYRNQLDWLTLAALDELGNRRFGVHSPGCYQRGWAWNAHLEACGFARKLLVHPAPCHSGVLGRMTNHLQFLGLWVRQRSF